ncbi:MAG: glycosyltransferase [Acidimicrobiales bacterium]
MTVLMITPYAPYRDGIAIYAVQEVRVMRRAGIDVEVMSPLPSAAHHHLVIGSATGMTRLLRLAGRYDKIIMQFYPELLFGACRGRVERLAVWRLLKQLGDKVPLELRIHEIDYAAATADSMTTAVARSALLAASKLQVHTDPEAVRLADALGIDRSTIELVEHGGNFESRTVLDKAAARRELGLSPDEHVFVSIGFVQAHKGFDRGVRAFGRAGLGLAGARYVVVGSVRVDHPDLLAYADDLTSLCESTPGAEFRQGFVGDEEFDTWLVAADTLVLPYREIWSSSVLERGELFGIPIVTTSVGGLAEQAPTGSVVVDNDDQLADALAAAADVVRPESDDDALLDRAELVQLIASRSGGDKQAGLSPIERLGQIALPQPNSARPGAAELKLLIQRLTAWQLEPVVDQLNSLQRTTAEAIARLNERLDESE